MSSRHHTARGYWESIARRGTWAGYYDRRPDSRTYNFFTRRAAVLDLLADEGELRRVLDVGCGTADYAPLAERHRATYVGVDFSLSMLLQARERTGEESGRHLFAAGAGDLLCLAEDSFDLAVAVGYIEYFDDPAATLEELERVLRPGGVLLMQSFKWDLLGRLRRSVGWMLGGRRGADPRLPPDWVDRKYSGRELDVLLGRHGFERVDYTYNNFYLLPEVVRRRWPRLYISLSEAIGRHAPRLFGFSAVNYLGKYRLREATR